MNTMELDFRVPLTKKVQSLESILQLSASWMSAAQRKLICRTGLYVDGILTKKASIELEPESRIRGEVLEPILDFDMYECPEFLRYEGISVIEKRVMMPGKLDDTPFDPLLYVADGLGFDREIFRPVWDAELMAGGPWLLAEDEEHALNFSKELTTESIVTTWVVMTPDAHHTKITVDDFSMDVALSKKVGEICELQITPHIKNVEDVHKLPELILSALASVDKPVLGDVIRGGFALEGGLRIRLLAMYKTDGSLTSSWTPPSGWWPSETIVPLRLKEKKTPNEKLISNMSLYVLREYIVSELSLRFINDGHPWVRIDKDTDRRDFDAGTFVLLKTPKGILGPVAIVSGEEPIVARYWGDQFQTEEELEEEIALRLDEAIALRGNCFADLASTDAFRLVNGENDQFPGVIVERLGPVLRVVVRSRGVFEGYRKLFYENLIAIEDELMIIEAVHSSDIRVKGELPKVKIMSHGKQQLVKDERVIIRELGLKYWAEVWEGIDVGFFCDQRENRRMLSKFTKKDSRWLNLFSHTGAFSLRLAQLGATTVNVDLSKRYLDWFLENLELNKFDTENHSCHAIDAREFLKQNEDIYDGIIVDPPTSSSGDAGFWSIKKDYEKLLIQCVEKLAPGGMILVCENERGGKTDLRTLIKSVTRKLKRKATFFHANAGADYPTKDAFPEGTTFKGVWVQVD